MNKVNTFSRGSICAKLKSMLHIITGKYNDRMEAIDKILSKQGSSSQTLRIDRKDLEEYSLPLLATESSMFGDKKIIILSDVFGTESDREEILSLAEEFAKSTNVFIIHEKKILKPTLTRLEKAGGRVHRTTKPDTKKRGAYDDEPYNLFLLTDALGARDKKKLWILFNEAVYYGAPIDEIHGLLNWQIKNMIMVTTAKENPGMHPFVYQKTSKSAKNFTLRELQELSSRLVTTFHDRETGIPMEIKLEQFVLEL